MEKTLLNLSYSVRCALRCLAAVPCFYGLSSVASAQAIPAPVVDSGSVLRQTQLPTVAPLPGLAAPDLVIPNSQQSAGSGGLKVEVKQFRIDGVSSSDAASLLPLLRPFMGPGKSLADLQAGAKVVEGELHRRGLFLAQVLVPAQRVVDGVVGLQVFEGRLGKVHVDLKPDADISPSLVDSTVEPLQGGPLIERDLVDGALLRLGDLRGVAVHSVLTPGDEPGTADLGIDVARGKRYAGEVEYDNGGSVYTGRDRLSVNLDAFDLAGRGDVASLTAQASTGTRFVQGSWLVPVNGSGTRVGPFAGWLNYKLGTPVFDPLDAVGSARWFGLQLQQPLQRSQNSNIYLQAAVGARRFDDEDRAVPTDDQKRTDDYGSIGLAGELRDTLGGLNNYSVTVSTGSLGIDDSTEAALDAQTYRTAGRYTTVSLALSRLQTLTSKDSILLATQAQVASRNLDSADKFSLGGSTTVRGYPPTDSPSDDAVTLTWEYHRLLGVALKGRWTASIFGDYGFGRLHEDPLPTDTDNTRHLQSHGLGLEYGNDSGLAIRSFVAVRGDTPAQADDRRAVFYIQASQSF
jgi:hemolysin activation/secretion protein